MSLFNMLCKRGSEQDMKFLNSITRGANLMIPVHVQKTNITLNNLITKLLPYSLFS